MLVVLFVVILLNIKKYDLTSSYLLESTGEDYRYHGEIIHIEGYAVKFPLSIYYAKGKATIKDLEWEMGDFSSSKGGYSVQFNRRWNRETEDVIEIRYDSLLLNCYNGPPPHYSLLGNDFYRAKPIGR